MDTRESKLNSVAWPENSRLIVTVVISIFLLVFVPLHPATAEQNRAAFVEIALSYTRALNAADVEATRRGHREERQAFGKALRNETDLSIRGRPKPVFRGITRLLERRKKLHESLFLARRLGRHITRRNSLPASRFSALQFLLSEPENLNNSFANTVRIRVADSAELDAQLTGLLMRPLGDFKVHRVRKIARGIHMSAGRIKPNRRLLGSFSKMLEISDLTSGESVAVDYITLGSNKKKIRNQLKKNCNFCNVRITELAEKRSLPGSKFEEAVLDALIKGADIIVIDAYVPSLAASPVTRLANRSGVLLIMQQPESSSIKRLTRSISTTGLSASRGKVLEINTEEQMTAAALAADIFSNTEANAAQVIGLLSGSDLSAPDVEQMSSQTSMQQGLNIIPSEDRSNAHLRFLTANGDPVANLRVDVLSDRLGSSVERTLTTDAAGKAELPPFDYTGGNRRISYVIKVAMSRYQFYCTYPACETDAHLIDGNDFYLALKAPGDGFDVEVTLLAHRLNGPTRTFRGRIYGNSIFDPETELLREDLLRSAHLGSARGWWNIRIEPDGTFQAPPVNAYEYYDFGFGFGAPGTDQDGFVAACRVSSWYAREDVSVTRWGRAIRRYNGHLLAGHVGSRHLEVDGSDAIVQSFTPIPGITVRVYGYPNGEKTLLGGGGTDALGCYSMHYTADPLVEGLETVIEQDCPLEDQLYSSRCRRDVVGIPTYRGGRSNWKFEFAENDFVLSGLIERADRWPDVGSVPGPQNPVEIAWLQDMISDDGNTEDDDQDGSDGGSDEDPDPQPDPDEDTDTDPNPDGDPDGEPTPSPDSTPDSTPTIDPTPQPTSGIGPDDDAVWKRYCIYDGASSLLHPDLVNLSCCGIGYGPYAPVCNPLMGENAMTCPSDCGGNEEPEPTPSYCSLPPKGAGAPQPTGCCGNGVCEPGSGEDLGNCAADCGAEADPDVKYCEAPGGVGAPPQNNCCGNKVCEYYDGRTEDALCPQDCLAELEEYPYPDSKPHSTPTEIMTPVASPTYLFTS